VAAPLLILLVACGSFSRQKALSDTMTGLNAGRDALIEWQKSCQERAVETATNETVANELVKVCRDKRDKIIKLFVVAYNALSLATMEPSDKNYLEAVLAVKAVFDAVKDLK
jgi:hypothetical protein